MDDPSVSKSHYVDMFCRARCVIKYHPVITDEGQVRPLNKEYAPNDIHEFIGYRLPDELYYYLMRGLISPQVSQHRFEHEHCFLYEMISLSIHLYQAF